MDTRYEGSFIVFLRVTLWFSLLAVFDATDVYMNCPADPWVIGNQVTIHCSALKTAYPSQCTSINREVQFRRSPNDASYTARCSLDDVDNTCTSSSSDCTCSNSNSTHFNFQYTFSVAADSSGYWECNVPCLNGITPQLTYSSSAGCKNRNVTVGPCDGVNCENSGTCYVDDNNQAKCNCSGTNYKGDFCETHICDGKDCNEGTCYVDGVTATCDCTGTSGGDDCSDRIKEFYMSIVFGCTVLVCLVLGVVLCFIFYTRRQTIEVCLLADVESQQKLASEDTKKRIHDHIKKTFICCCCHGIDVIVCANSTCGLVTITLKYRVIWVFYLLDLQAKVEEFIYKDILPQDRPRPGDCVTPRQTPSEKSSCENTTRGPTPTRCLADCFTPRQTPSEKSSCENTTRGPTPTRTDNRDIRVEPTPDYSVGKTMPQPKYTGKGNGVQR